MTNYSSESKNYTFKIPQYIYDSTDLIHPLLEIYRLKLILDLIDQLKILIDKKIGDSNIIRTRKIKKYFSQLIMNTTTNRTFTDSNIIRLDDGLLNRATHSETNGFYNDLNYLSKQELFQNDEFNIKESIDKIIQKIKAFSNKIVNQSTNLYTYYEKEFRYAIDNNILKKFDLENMTKHLGSLIINQDIINKTKSKFTGKDDQYHVILLCCLLRYLAFGSDTNQFVVDLEYKKKLKEYGVNFECFASSLNHYYDNYCSIFYDIEKYFGSKGSFMCLKIIKGFYMANPPYDENLLLKMYQKVSNSLKNTEPIALIMSIPKWKDFPLETQINNDHLYKVRQLKYEYFMDPIAKQMVLIPPYISYLFFNDSFSQKNAEIIVPLENTFETFTNYNLEFPARNKIYDNKYKIALFKKLLDENLVEIVNEKKKSYSSIKLNNIDYLYSGQYHYLIVDYEKYKYYVLSDLFNDECRIKCSFGDSISPMDFFEKNKSKIIEALIDKNIEINPINLREQIYYSLPECSTHNPLIIKSFIKRYSAKKVLDFSSGWGDRLIGALLSDIDLYLGVDPNECLHPNYQKMIELFKPLSPNPKAQFTMVTAPFEKYNIPSDLSFDLIYTSPPYFDYEKYTNLSTQSIKNYNTEDKWLKDFLYMSVDKCLNHLINGGHFVIYISQDQHHTYTEKFMAWAKAKHGVYYLGNMFKSTEDFKKLHPIFIFEKNKIIPKQLYDPPIVIAPIKHKNINLNIVREDLLVGGTKIRGAINFMKQLLHDNPNINELLYTGASNGYGQIAIAYSLYLLKSNVKLKIYSQKINLDYAEKIYDLVRYLHPLTEYIVVEQKLSDIWQTIEKYISKNPNSMEIPFGLDNPQFKHFLSEALTAQLEPYRTMKRLWLVGGSATLLNVLFDILPNTQFHLVQVGKTILLTDEQKTRVTIYVSSYKLYEDIDVPIPYPTVPSYDGKIWEFSDKFKEGDFIWNVAGIHNKI